MIRHYFSAQVPEKEVNITHFTAFSTSKSYLIVCMIAHDIRLNCRVRVILFPPLTLVNAARRVAEFFAKRIDEMVDVGIAQLRRDKL